MAETESDKFKQRVREVFSLDGPLSRATSGYVVREAQVEFALKIADALENNTCLVAEAGTGTGKTFAYLVPALLYGGKVLISTAGKTLQDQLFEKDLPALSNALGIPFKRCILKGRSNYVCKRKLEQAQHENIARSREEAKQLDYIIKNEKYVRKGLRTEFKGVPERSRIWHDLTSQGYDCHPEKCPFKEDCYLMQARNTARNADVLVVNHHLFLADLSLKMEDLGEILADFDLIVLDEAHKVPRDAETFFTQTLALFDVKNVALDTAAFVITQDPKKSTEWADYAKKISNACDDLRNQFALFGLPESFRGSLFDFKDKHLLAEPMELLANALRRFIDDIKEQSFLDEGEISQYLDQLEGFEIDARFWKCKFDGTLLPDAGINKDPENKVPSIEWISLQPKSANFNVTPLSFSAVFQKAREDKGKPWVATSATLSINGDFSHFTEQMGLTEAEVGRWPSPFNYPEQGLLYVPKNAGDPNSQEFPVFVAEHSWPLVKRIGGKTLILCTTLRNMKTISDILRDKIEQEDLDLKLFVQDEAPRNDLITNFRNSSNGILIGSMSFWEGIDIKGQALSMVIIDKMPFAPVDDPILKAKTQWYEENGRKGFWDISLPEAIKLLQQGAGRLIRDKDDWGIVSIFDSRIITSKSWGPQVWKALPPFRRTTLFENVMDFLDRKGVPPLEAKKKVAKGKFDVR